MDESQARTPTSRRISRRQLLVGGIAAGASLAYAGPALSAIPYRRRDQVVVLGGGVGGLTVAHELAERGFAVTVIEPKALGGKARSIPVPGTGAAGRADLPGEHGFRFFPGFYKNIPDTMRRIPVAGNAEGVFTNLVDASQELLLFDGNQRFYSPPTESTLLQDWQGPIQAMQTIVTAIGIGAQVPPNQIEYFTRKLEVFFTSCDERRVGEWEYVSWWDFVNAANFSSEYQRVFGAGLTKDLVAAKGTVASTRTIGLMAEAFVYDLMGQYIPAVSSQSGYAAADRLLDGPTNEAWIDPWVSHLRRLGVRFVMGQRATALEVRNGRIAATALQDAASGARSEVEADWFVCAMPVEQMVPLLSPPVLAADPTLARLRKLQTDWMNGIQFFLNRPPSLAVKGHVAFLDTPWSLTAIDQGLFWNRNIAASYGNGQVTDIYSVDISDFFTPGIVYGKAAVDCTPDQIAHEVWAQMQRQLNTSSQTVLSDDMVVTWSLDPAITYPSGDGPASNGEPLLINTTGSLDDRPDAHTAIPNLFLAADYVKTNIDLATMEGANEAGRQAANAILTASGSNATPATIATLWQPAELDPFFQIDQARYTAGQPNPFDTIPAGSL